MGASRVVAWLRLLPALAADRVVAALVTLDMLLDVVHHIVRFHKRFAFLLVEPLAWLEDSEDSGYMAELADRIAVVAAQDFDMDGDANAAKVGLENCPAPVYPVARMMKGIQVAVLAR